MSDSTIPLYTEHYASNHPGLPGGNAQTLFPYFNKPRRNHSPTARERWELDDAGILWMSTGPMVLQTPLWWYFSMALREDHQATIF